MPSGIAKVENVFSWCHMVCEMYERLRWSIVCYNIVLYEGAVIFVSRKFRLGIKKFLSMYFC